MKYGEFYPRADTEGHSICLACFLSVKATKWETLQQAEQLHRQECPNKMQLSEELQSLWAEAATEQIQATMTPAPITRARNPRNLPPDVQSPSVSSLPSRRDSTSQPRAFSAGKA